MELVMGEGEGRCGPGPRGSRQAAARSSLAPACSESSCSVSGRLCQAAEGRGTQCLARPPGGTGSSGAQGPWSEYTAKPQLAAPKGGHGPARPSGRWACPPGGCSGVGGCPVSSGGLAWRGRKRRSSVFASTSNLQAAPSTPPAADIPHSTAPTSTARKEPNESNRRSTRPTMSADAHGRNRRAQLISTHPPTQLSV